MTRLPGLVVAVDAKKEYLALREAKKLGIPTVGILDTDSDPDTVDVVIPANDDSIRAIELILNELSEAVAVGKTIGATRQQAPQAVAGFKRGRPHRSVLARAGQGVAADQEAPEGAAEAASEPETSEAAEPESSAPAEGA
jgi:small subunit ribosomal protein S2